ncbi:MAG TPA: ABC transporter permease [Tepidisphaeraceae bacterium]|nr:ABC transporter permease [Tepidisphaeraceae bacterium]
MLFGIVIIVALRNLWVHKLRTSLAMLGIMIGVCSVIAMLSIGAGARQMILRPIEAMGTNLLVVRPAPHGANGVVTGQKENLVIADAMAIVDLPGVRAVAPLVSDNKQVKYLQHNANVAIVGTCSAYLQIRDFSIAEGRSFNDAEVDGLGRVCVLGQTTARKLFVDQNPLAQTVKIAGINFRVIGTLNRKGDQGWFNPDDQIIIPYTTAMRELFGINWLHEIDVEADGGAALPAVEAEVKAILRQRHKVQTDAPDDVQVQNQAEVIQTTNTVMTTFAVLIGSMAGICLLVGGIGIMNIMLVSVTERTREIGIRKAIGARNRDILGQFLIESVLLSCIGGLGGVALGITAAWLVNKLSPFPSILQPNSIFLAMGFSTAVGIFFGYYPANRASKLNPIDALRYE